jgi:acid phosphatase family membrane protein YuiD
LNYNLLSALTFPGIGYQNFYNKTDQCNKCLNSGGFPSSHISMVVILTTLLGIKYGFSSDMSILMLTFFFLELLRLPC